MDIRGWVRGLIDPRPKAAGVTVNPADPSDPNYIPSSLEALGKEVLMEEASAVNTAYRGAYSTFSPLTSPSSAQRRRNLQRSIQDDQLEVAHAMYKFNPLASRSVNITAEYIVGDGIQFTALNKNVMGILARHWDDPTNRWSILQTARARELCLSGELIIPAYVNSVNGGVTLGHIDPERVDAVLVDPANNLRMYAIVLRPEVGVTRSDVRKAYRVINVADHVGPDSPVFGKRVGLPRDEEEASLWGMDYWKGKKEKLEKSAGLQLSSASSVTIEWAGQCFYMKSNSPIGATRGWSDLLPSLDWIDAHDQFLFAAVEKAVNAGRYIVDILLEGMTEEQQREWLTKNRRNFTAGQWFVHNETVTADFNSPDLKMEDTSVFGGMLKNQSLSGMGHPPIWYAESGESRAAAPEMTEPAFKHIKSKQREFAYSLSEIFRYCIDMAEVYGYVKFDGRMTQGSERDTSSRTFYLRLPDVSAKDQRMLSIAVMNIATALEKMVKVGLDAEEAVRIFNRYAELLGFDAWKSEPYSKEVVTDPEFVVGKLTERIQESVEEIVNRTEESLHVDEYTRGGSTFYLYRDTT